MLTCASAALTLARWVQQLKSTRTPRGGGPASRSPPPRRPHPTPATASVRSSTLFGSAHASSDSRQPRPPSTPPRRPTPSALPPLPTRLAASALPPSTPHSAPAADRGPAVQLLLQTIASSPIPTATLRPRQQLLSDLPAVTPSSRGPPLAVVSDQHHSGSCLPPGPAPHQAAAATAAAPLAAATTHAAYHHRRGGRNSSCVQFDAQLLLLGHRLPVVCAAL